MPPETNTLDGSFHGDVETLVAYLSRELMFVSGILPVVLASLWSSSLPSP
jgi:hypothetical protein